MRHVVGRAVAAAVLSAVVPGCSSRQDTFAVSATSESAATDASPATVVTSSSSTSVQVRAQVWVDNWYALYVNGQKVAEDSEPITQVRSFNADTITFSATYPMTIALVTKDYTEGTSGLEYIGTPRQQMGDGGFIAQFADAATGKVIAVTDQRWRGLVVQRAPLDPSCVTKPDPNTSCPFESTPEPEGWTTSGFDASRWATASVYTAAQVGPKGGYDTVTWDPTAKLIWTSDLFVDNTILWRHVVPTPD